MGSREDLPDTPANGAGQAMARVKFSVQESGTAPAASGSSDAAAELGAQRADAFWWDSAWELRHGVEVIELAEVPAEYFAVLRPAAAR